MTTIRRASAADVDAIHALGKNVDEFSVGDGTVGFWPKDVLKTAVASSDVVVLVAEEDEQLAGFILAAYSHGLKKSTIENVYVAPAYRGAGVGGELLAQLLVVLAQKGCEYVATLVPLGASGAINLYKQVGFATGEKFLWLDKALSGNFNRTNHKRNQ